MHITLADVISLNGKITKGDDPNIHSWSSTEDWEHFVRLRDEHDVIVIDRNTYETVKPQSEPGKLRIILTSKPDHFADANLPGKLEFLDLSPVALVKHLISQGHQKVLVAGGAKLCSSFLAAGLVDHIYISFEPMLFGTGKPMLSDDPLDISLQLQSVRKLNERGTLLAHYTVIKTD